MPPSCATTRSVSSPNKQVVIGPLTLRAQVSMKEIRWDTISAQIDGSVTVDFCWEQLTQAWPNTPRASAESPKEVDCSANVCQPKSALQSPYHG